MTQLQESELLLRYTHWSAARICKRINEMSSDEMWRMANQTSPAGPAGPPHIIPSTDLPPPYLELVAKATLAIARELGLPKFEEWKEAYLQDPALFDREVERFTLR